jgi:hypothetical protein
VSNRRIIRLPRRIGFQSLVKNVAHNGNVSSDKEREIMCGPFPAERIEMFVANPDIPALGLLKNASPTSGLGLFA